MFVCVRVVCVRGVNNANTDKNAPGDLGMSSFAFMLSVCVCVCLCGNWVLF